MRTVDDMIKVLEHQRRMMKLALAVIDGSPAKINAVLFDQPDDGRLVAEPKGEM